METVECGAAALTIVLGYFGRYVPLEEMREACGVSRDGSKASNILKVARHHGLDAQGYRRPAEKALSGTFPTIVFWNFNHFLVVEGLRGDRVFLNDPAIGPRTVSRQEFDSSYSGIVLTFEKSATFEPMGAPPRILPRLAAQARGYGKQLGFVLLVGALISLPAFVVPGFTTVFVDDILIKQQNTWLAPTILALAGAIIIQAGLSWLKESTLIRMETAMALRRSAEFLWHVLRLPVTFFGQRYLGDITNRVTSVENVARLLTTDLGGASINALTAALLFVMMILLDPVLAALSIGGALINVIAVRVVHRARTDTAIRLQTEQGKLFANSVIGIRAIETLKATGGEDYFFGKWAGYHARCINSEQRLSRLDQISLIVPPLIAMATTALALAAGGLRVMDGVLTLGTLLAYQALFSSVSVPVQHMVETAGRSQQAAADLARLEDVFNYPLDWRHAPKARNSDTSEEEPSSMVGLRLENVSFGYNPLEPPLIESLNIEVRPGDWVALVGPSGSGKSTIGRLISGLYSPWTGDVLFDGKPIKSFERRELARLVMTVDQEIALFDGTVRENICLWDPTIEYEEMFQAASDAELSDLIATMPGNFDGRIEEEGRNLSGGQRQRIEIARGLVRSPAVLVLDEATSALDPATELAIMNALRRRGMTCVLIAHRLSTIRDCDEIIVLDQGRIVERGRHDYLMAQGGAYARLIAEGASA